MNFGLKGKKALVTGASRGIGESIALNLAKEGVKVALVARDLPNLRKVLSKIKGKGHSIIDQDLMDQNGPQRVINELEASVGQPDILVNNLGSTMGITDPFCTLNEWRKIYRMNFEIAVEMCNLVIPNMQRKKWGRIVNIASISALENHGPVTYCAMKAALVAYSHSMGRILAKSGIVISTILPGAVLTKGGFWDEAIGKNPAHVKKYLRDRCPLGRFGDSDDIGAMTVMLCSNQAKFCQGTVLPVDGGQMRSFQF
jgi:3-oxoacyl-[acyl-carrier protein] reductase